jgi:Uma2 family endonuclease
MQLTINLPERETVLANVLSHWDGVIRDPFYASLEGRFESNSLGQVLMSPPPPPEHSDRSWMIAEHLVKFLGGKGRTKYAIATIDGVRMADAVWMSESTYRQGKGKPALTQAPEICVEVISPSNTETEMQHKRNLYFDAGAKECWICDLEGRMIYYTAADPNTPKTHSELCSDFPGKISD